MLARSRIEQKTKNLIPTRSMNVTTRIIYAMSEFTLYSYALNYNYTQKLIIIAISLMYDIIDTFSIV